MAEVSFTIDGLEFTANEDMTVLEAALENGIYIPHLCHHPDLAPAGMCRLCMVEIDGRRMVISCKTPLKDGMVVRTESEQINRIRKIAVELLIANHQGDCLSCNKSTSCELQRISSYLGINKEDMDRMRRFDKIRPIDTSNPFFDYDPNKCVLCGICVRTCTELQGVSAIDLAFRGFDTSISTFGAKPWVESNCESCGECIVRCPVGALMPKDGLSPSLEVKSVCSYCGCGCGMYLGVRAGRIVSVKGEKDNPSNRGSLCVKGRFGYEFVNHPQRLTEPLIKKDGEFVEASWDEALELVTEKFSQYKGEQFASIASAKCTNEENYVLQKFTREVMGTNNIDHCARL